jgi:uncharacterized membrane protein YkoI
MPYYPRAPFLFVAGITLLAVISYPLAENKRSQDRARQLRENKDILPLEQILEQAKARHPGRLIEAELDQEENNWIYQIEILDENGVVWKMDYDATTSKLLKADQDQ